MSSDAIADLLEQAATNPADEAIWRGFISALLDTEVVGFEYVEGSSNTPGQPMLVDNPNGTLWPFFSSIETAQLAWDALGGEETGTQPVTYSCRAVWSEAVRQNMRTAINILNDYSKEFLVDEMAEYLGGTSDAEFVRIDTSQQVMIREPSYVPDGLRKTLYEFIEDKPAVKRAYLAWVRYDNGHEGYLLVVVTDTEQAVIVDGLDDVVAAAEGVTVDVWVQPVEGSGAQGIEPFYIGLDL